jgi:RNA polymerase sigma-70 factor (ECF subfamily)
MFEEDKGVSAGAISSPAVAQSVRGPSSASDAAVIEALRTGDEEAFARLIDQHHPSLRRIARLYVSSEAVADEVVQDTWLAVIQGVWAFEGRSSLKTWILKILINRAKTRAVREGRTVPLEELSADDTRHKTADDGAAQLYSTPPDPTPSPEARLLTEEARTQIRSAIDSLPPNQRVVITMRDVEGCSSEEVCNVLGLSETNQRVILHRARSKVRDLVSAYFREE